MAIAQTRKSVDVLLWTVQGLLAALFLFAGVTKLMMPIEAMTSQMDLPGWFFRFIGVAETAGAFGLVLPLALGIRPVLTPLAACGLAIIMVGATVLTASTIPATVCLLTVVVAWGRWQTVRPVSRRLVLESAR